VHRPGRGTYSFADQGSKLCLTIIGTPPKGPLHEGMQCAASCHTEMVMWLSMLWAAVSWAIQSMLGRMPTEAVQVDIVGGGGESCLLSSRSRQIGACTSRILARGSAIGSLGWLMTGFG
jgi:hypothetical protein